MNVMIKRYLFVKSGDITEYEGFQVNDCVEIRSKSIGKSLAEIKQNREWPTKAYIDTIGYRSRYDKVIIVADGNHYLPEDLFNLSPGSIRREVDNIFDLDNL